MSTKFTDGKQFVELELRELDSHTGKLLPDWSVDFYDLAILDTDDRGAYIIDDVHVLIEQVLDWKYSTGDWHSAQKPAPGFRFVYVNGVYQTRDINGEVPPIVGNTEARLDPITHQPISKYDNECSAILSSTRWIRQLCDTIDHTFRHISDKADPKLVSEIVAEVRRAENALSFANNAKWRYAK